MISGGEESARDGEREEEFLRGQWLRRVLWDYSSSRDSLSGRVEALGQSNKLLRWDNRTL